MSNSSNSQYKKSNEQILRDKRQAAISVLYGIRNLPAYQSLYKYLELELELSKSALLDLEGDKLLEEKGGAKKLRALLEVLRNPRRP